MEGQRIAVLGGTFNPIHNGHLYLATAFLQRLCLNQVLLIPTGIPPHKEAADLATGEQRLRMCLLAAAGNPALGVRDLELRREGKSYTVDTLRQLRQEFPGAALYLITGADMFLTLDRWVAFREILSLATVCAAPRDAVSATELRRFARVLEQAGGNALVLDEFPPAISSTMVRQMVKAGKSIEGLVPKAVEEYIRSNNLYR